MKKIPIFSLLAFIATTIVFSIALSNTLQGSTSAKILLLITGIIEFSISFCFLKVGEWKEYNICEECGTRRIHHRYYISTTSETKGDVTYYKHIYTDTFECPNCGTYREKEVKASGGTTSYTSTGYKDNTTSPKEF